MEHAVIQSDLIKQEINPQPSMEKYIALLNKDIKKILRQPVTLQAVSGFW